MITVRSRLVVLLAAASSVGCTTPFDESGCQDISGIIGREYRFSFLSAVTSQPVDAEAGMQASSTFPEISRDYRETLIMGDHLCRAAEAGLIDSDVYESYLNAQLGALGAEAVRTGRATPEQAAARQAVAARQIEAAARRRADLDDEAIAQGARAASANDAQTNFSEARRIYDGVRENISNVPQSVGDPLGDAGYNELIARFDRLTTEINDIKTQRLASIAQDDQVLGFVLFAFNSDALDADAHRELDGIVRAGGLGSVYRVEGFADPSGPYAANIDLTQRRADAVANHLRSEGAANVVVTIASGRTDRFGPDARLNRRVTVSILRSTGPPAEDAATP
jgi:outer membrane protein OmpA-like peptidoglycan-associated protein